ncbi:hypothetical protein DFH11DRAFT_1728354 [Phellopilus nigrolimitatus]|nr:hypothetical protein DFH11DRAFT_1728354 [Phellopilus nigrolimitatus]
MGRKWTTKKQRKYLKKVLPNFLKAQKEDNTQLFLPPTYEQYFEKFPIPSPTGEQIEHAKGDVEAAHQLNMKKATQRVKTWLYNRARSTSQAAASSRKNTINLAQVKKKKGRVTEIQAYMKLYQRKLKARNEGAYSAYKSKLKEEESTEEVLDSLTFTRLRNEEVYAQEPEHVKNRVKRVMAEFNSGKLATIVPDKDDSDSDSDEHDDSASVIDDPARQKLCARADAIACVQNAMEVILNNFLEQTGWTIAVLFGGPNPHKGGSLDAFLLESEDRSSSMMLGPVFAFGDGGLRVRGVSVRARFDGERRASLPLPVVLALTADSTSQSPSVHFVLRLSRRVMGGYPTGRAHARWVTETLTSRSRLPAADAQEVVLMLVLLDLGLEAFELRARALEVVSFSNLSSLRWRAASASAKLGASLVSMCRSDSTKRRTSCGHLHGGAAGPIWRVKLESGLRVSTESPFEREGIMSDMLSPESKSAKFSESTVLTEPDALLTAEHKDELRVSRPFVPHTRFVNLSRFSQHSLLSFFAAFPSAPAPAPIVIDEDDLPFSSHVRVGWYTYQYLRSSADSDRYRWEIVLERSIWR